MSAHSKIHLIGSAHLDPIWLWRWQEGCGEVLQTFRSALDRLNEYPDFVFTCSSAAYYKWVEEIAPDMFEEIVARVKEGRWVPVNGWWVQPDCNMPSGESFARQALYSQLYYYEKFGKICSTGYNVDSFGHNGNLPQLIFKGGMNAYVMMRPGEHEHPGIPWTFLWKGIDGTKMPTFRIKESYTASGQRALDDRMAEAEQRIAEDGHGVMLFYGVGNHGGGPTRWDIEYMQQNLTREGYHRMKFDSPDGYFHSLCCEMPDLPIWEDDLQHHASGCYSATSLVKQLNRRAENALYAAEAFSTAAAKTAGMGDKSATFKEAWHEVNFNQFHDILCGCSIMEAYEDVRDAMGHALNLAAKTQNEALLRMARQVDTWVEGVSEPYAAVRNHDCPFPRPVIVFNPLSFPVKAPVRSLNPSHTVKDEQGNDVPFQNVRSSRSNDSHLDTLFLADLPAYGYRTYWMELRDWEHPVQTAVTGVKAEGLSMENEHLSVTFDEKTGFITGLTDKAAGFDYASPDKPVAVPTVIKDDKTDTWAHNVFTFHDVMGTMALESIELVESGPARAVIRTKHTFGKSSLTQDFILGSEQKTLRVKCKALWQEQFTLLKMSFPVAGDNAVNYYEIPGGMIRRPCDGDEEPAGKFGAISFDNGARRTLAVVNDSKYSYDCPGNDLRLTGIRNVIFADHYSHRPAANFNFCDEGLQRFEYGVYVADGEAGETDAAKEAIGFNVRPAVVSESFHKGTEPQCKSLMSVSADNVVMTACKFCEDGSGDTVLRFYETSGRETRAHIVCDMLDAAFTADFGPFEVKTFRIDAEGRVTETNFLEGIV